MAAMRRFASARGCLLSYGRCGIRRRDSGPAGHPAASAASSLARRLLPPAEKHRHISAHGNIDAHRFRAALVGKMLRQPLAQLPRIVADNVVFERAIIRRPVKDLHPDLVFSDFVAPAFQRFRHHKKQKLRQQGRPCKVRSGHHALRQVPSAGRLAAGRPCLVGERRLGLGLDGGIFHWAHLLAATQGRRAVAGSTVAGRTALT